MRRHPDVSGRQHVLLIHERLIKQINKQEGGRMGDNGGNGGRLSSNNKPPGGAMMPASPGEMLRKKPKEFVTA